MSSNRKILETLGEEEKEGKRFHHVEKVKVDGEVYFYKHGEQELQGLMQQELKEAADELYALLNPENEKDEVPFYWPRPGTPITFDRPGSAGDQTNNETFQNTKGQVRLAGETMFEAKLFEGGGAKLAPYRGALDKMEEVDDDGPSLNFSM